MYLRFHSVKEPSKNHDICVRDLFGSLRGRDRFGLGLCTFKKKNYFRFRVRCGSWQNLGSGSVCSCWVQVLSHLY